MLLKLQFIQDLHCVLFNHNFLTHQQVVTLSYLKVDSVANFALTFHFGVRKCVKLLLTLIISNTDNSNYCLIQMKYDSSNNKE